MVGQNRRDKEGTTVKKNIPPFRAFTKQEPTDVVQQVRTYQLITPLFGGGVKPGEVDMLTPIRGSEIRGHLRFWWRACRGGQWENLRDMKIEEDRIWGKAYKKGEDAPKYDGLVSIQVEILKKDEQKFIKPFINDLEKKRPKHVRRDIPSYAAFSLQASQQEFEQGDPPERSVLSKLTFIMTITFPKKHNKDVKAALWAWERLVGLEREREEDLGH
jgi:CRISPR-associated protein Cmr1